MAQAAKEYVLGVRREGIAPCYVKRVSRDGSVTMTWDLSKARRMSWETSRRHEAALATAQRPLEPIEVSE